MGRVDNNQAYQIKNTFVEVGATDESEFSRSQRTLSDTGAQRPGAPQSPGMGANFMPSTPSPYYSAQPDPCMIGPDGMQYMDPSQLDGMAALPALAFGDFAPDVSCGQGYNLGEAAGYGSIQYDPNTGAYMAFPYDQINYVPYDTNCYNMVGMEQMEDNRTAEQHTQVLLNALSEKIGEDQLQGSGEAPLESNIIAPGNGEELTTVGELEIWDGQAECWEGDANGGWEGGSWGNNYNNGGNYGSAEDQHNMGSQQAQPGRRRAERREAREAARRQAAASNIGTDNGNAGQEDASSKGASQWAASQNKSTSGPVTTVMFRNIPNKYTREMLVNQLEQDMRGLFDFIYLPIDFKNKCNVGYAFINFRTVDACDSFVSRFNGVEVRKCLPGLNSRKVTEVTPARVQGFEENVQRLRNSPVMRELVHKPEWMPLIFDYNGDQISFPGPERPLEPIKPRRRARDEEARLL